MSNYNVLIYQQGGTLHLDEVLPDQPTAATITITTLAGQALSTIHSSFDDVSAAACTLDNLVLTLPAKSQPWKTVAPSGTAGTIGDMTAEGRRFLLNRGGRKLYVKVSEFDTALGAVTEVRFDEGIDFSLKVGDTLKGIRVSYAVDWSDVTDDFTGRVMATWRVTVGGVVYPFRRIYDVVRQTLHCPATWADVVRLRKDADNELSQVKDKESLVRQAWDEIVRDLYASGIRHNLVVQDGSTVLRDATVIQTIRNAVFHQSLPIPPGYIGQAEDYIKMLERDRSSILGVFRPAIDEDQDGTVQTNEVAQSPRRVWFRRVAMPKGND